LPWNESSTISATSAITAPMIAAAWSETARFDPK
jgi:hypothetical protein